MNRITATLTISKGTADGQWYWHSTRKGRITADGAEGYTSHAGAVRAARAEVRALRGRVRLLDANGRVIGFVEAE